MKDKLLNEIMMALVSSGVDIGNIKSRLILILDNYEITDRCTEISVIEEDDSEKYLRLFLVNKRVAGRTERTLKQYKAELTRFLAEVSKSPLNITSDDIKIYLATKEVRDGASKVYQKNILRVVSSFFQWMIREEFITKNPMNKVDEIKTPKTKKEAFSEIQIEQLRAKVGDDIRLLCIFEMLVSTWCRVSELAQIKVKDFSEAYGSVLVHGKGEKERICYLNAKTRIILERYLSERNDANEYLFPKCNISVTSDKGTFSKACKNLNIKPREWWKYKELVSCEHIDKSTIESHIRKLGRKAGIEKTHPHRFRRTGATMALRRGMPIEQVSKLLGHESIETTQIYLDVSEQELEQAHKKYV